MGTKEWLLQTDARAQKIQRQTRYLFGHSQHRQRLSRRDDKVSCSNSAPQLHHDGGERKLAQGLERSTSAEVSQRHFQESRSRATWGTRLGIQEEDARGDAQGQAGTI